MTDQPPTHADRTAHGEVVDLEEILQLRALGGLDCVLVVEGPRHIRVRIGMSRGRVVFAQSPTVSGEEALFEALRWPEVVLAEVRDNIPPMNNIHRPLPQLLVEAHWRAEQEEHEGSAMQVTQEVPYEQLHDILMGVHAATPAARTIDAALRARLEDFSTRETIAPEMTPTHPELRTPASFGPSSMSRSSAPAALSEPLRARLEQLSTRETVVPEHNHSTGEWSWEEVRAWQREEDAEMVEAPETLNAMAHSLGMDEEVTHVEEHSSWVLEELSRPRSASIAEDSATPPPAHAEAGADADADAPEEVAAETRWQRIGQPHAYERMLQRGRELPGCALVALVEGDQVLAFAAGHAGGLSVTQTRGLVDMMLDARAGFRELNSAEEVERFVLNTTEHLHTMQLVTQEPAGTSRYIYIAARHDYTTMAACWWAIEQLISEWGT